MEQLHSRNDTDHSLQFACDIISADGTSISARGVACPKQTDPGGAGSAIVQGGWQEGRGDTITNQYTAPSLNDSYFVENIKEETDAQQEWFYDSEENALYVFDAVCFVYTCRRLIDLPLIAGTSSRPRG